MILVRPRHETVGIRLLNFRQLLFEAFGDKLNRYRFIKIIITECVFRFLEKRKLSTNEHRAKDVGRLDAAISSGIFRTAWWRWG